MPLTFTITITTDNPDGAEIVRQATDKIACELDWGNDHSTNIEAVEESMTMLPRCISMWFMEPGDMATGP